MPVVKVEWLAGRSYEQKQTVAKEITESMARVLGLDPENIWIIFEDVPRENWSIGGKLRGEPKAEK